MVAIVGYGQCDTSYRRIDDPNDLVRQEVEIALSLRKLIVPIPVLGAKMPRVDELPESIQDLAYRSPLELSDRNFKYDLDKLLFAPVERVLAREPYRLFQQAISGNRFCRT
jgi:hypothetical protein